MLMWLHKLSEAEEVLETALLAVLGLHISDLPALYDILAKLRAPTLRPPPSLLAQHHRMSQPSQQLGFVSQPVTALALGSGGAHRDPQLLHGGCSRKGLQSPPASPADSAVAAMLARHKQVWVGVVYCILQFVLYHVCVCTCTPMI